MPNISESAEPIITKFSALLDIWVGMNNLSLVLAVGQGTFYCNQLIFGAIRRRRY